MTTARALFAVAAVALAATAAPAADLSINNRGDEKKFVENLAIDVLKAARTSPKDPTFVEVKEDKTDPKKLKWAIKATYKGSVSGKVFNADIVVHINTADAKKWAVESIEMTDDNKVSLTGPSKSGIEKLRTTLNK